MKGRIVFAIVTDPRRRMRCRVVRVVVEEVFELGCAMVSERYASGTVGSFALGTTHFLPFSRLASKRKDIATKLRAYVESMPVACVTCDQPGAESDRSVTPRREENAPEYWYQREPEFSAETAGEQLAGVESQTAAA